MVKKMHKAESTEAGQSGPQLSGTVKESAQQIWLAGLAAFTRAQQEGGKVFEALVKEGTSIQRKTQAAAEEKITEATSRMASMATDISSKASGQWGKLEDIFEERVAKALNKLGVPSSKDIDVLVARIDELNRSVAAMGAKGTNSAAAKPAAKAAKSPAAKAPAAKKSAAKSAARRAPAAKSA